MQDVRVIVPSDLDGTTVRLNLMGKVEAVIDPKAIPEKEFIDGSKVLAVDPSGTLYKFGQNSDYFKDGALEMYTVSSELLTDGSTQHTVRITVSNTRDNLIPTATVAVSSGNTITDFTVESSNAAGALWDGSTINITNLAAFGSVSVQLRVTNKYNDYVSASLVIDGDVVDNNNHVTINLQRKPPPPSSANVYTKECPLITATFDGQQLSQMTQTRTPLAQINEYGLMFINMIDQQTLNGSTMVFNGASSVRVFLAQHYYTGNFYGVAFVRELEPNKYRGWGFATDGYYEATTDDYTFSDGTLVFTTTAKSAIVFVRTGGSECMWQQYYIGTFNGDTTLTVNGDRIDVIGLGQQYYRYTTLGTSFGGDNFKNLPAIESSSNLSTNLTDVRYFSSMDYWDSQDKYNHYMMDATINAPIKLIIEIPSGTQVSFSVSRYGVLPNQQGAVSTDVAGNVVVSADAAPTDSVYTHLVDIIIT